MVNTSSVQNQGFPWLIQLGAKLFLPLIGQSPDKTAETIYKIATDPFYEQGEFKETHSGSLGPDGKPVKLCQALLEHPEWREQVWEYVDKVTQKKSG